MTTHTQRASRLALVALAAMTVLAGFSYAPASAEAACSANGYLNSNGTCAASWRNHDDRRDAVRERFEEARSEALDRYIERLRALIARLEAMRDDDGDTTTDFDVTTRSATDIETNAATLGGEVDFVDEDELEVWFQYGQSTDTLNQSTDRETLDENDSPSFEMDVADLDEDERYYFRAVAENEDGDREYGEVLSFVTSATTTVDFDVTTLSATDINTDAATLRGEVDFVDEDELEVWFQYGQSTDTLNQSTDRETLDENDSPSFEMDVADLDEDERYYFRAVAENEDDEREYGQVASFDTLANTTTDQTPTVDVDEVASTTNDSAELRGSVDMNDFENGIVFFAYGEEEQRVDGIADDYDRYADVEEDGSNLQKVQVDTDLDGSDVYTTTIGGLTDSTDVFVSLCVEYEDAAGDDTLTCSATEQLETN